MQVNRKIIESLTTDKPIVVHQGGTSCFGPDTLVQSIHGPKKITDVIKGEFVKTYDERTGKNIFKPVIKTLKFKNKKNTLKVRLRNGQEIIATDDHEFYFKGDWVSLKHILSLKEKDVEKDTKL